MTTETIEPYRPKHPVRIVTAASLFDGHDAAINIMRRILQSSGAEVIHLGHNRSVAEIVHCAIQEDAQAVAITSYQGGHIEYFKYMYDLLEKAGSATKIFGGGGGTILPSEIEELHAYGIARIYAPDDGRQLGLQGMINDLLEQCDFPTITPPLDGHITTLPRADHRAIAQLISLAENYPEESQALAGALSPMLEGRHVPVLGITGTGGAGKSSLVDELVRRFLVDFEDKSIAIISVDPSKRRTGGALLGDRIRMNSIDSPRAYMRSLATRQSNLALSKHVQAAIDICKAAGFDLVVVETSGIGQSDTEIVEHSDVALYVMTAEYGAATQLEKIDMLDFADLIAINKFDKRGSLDALRDVRKQYKRNRQLFDAEDSQLPIYGTIASQFSDPGTNTLYRKLMDAIAERTGADLHSSFEVTAAMDEKHPIIPPDRVRYLAEICEESDRYGAFAREQSELARQLFQLSGTIEILRADAGRTDLVISEPEGARGTVKVIQHEAEEPDYLRDLIDRYNKLESQLDPECRRMLEAWPATVERYKAEKYRFEVRDRVIEQDLFTTSLSHLEIPKVALPKYRDWGEILYWLLTENAPGMFPYAAGVFPLKRQGEDPARMFAGEGGPERTNKRFHYVSQGMPAKRLSTAFDSVTLYGEDPAHRPDIYGKVGNSGVSIATVDDAKKLYSGFDLCDPATSVSMTINGPAPTVLAFFLNTVIDQQVDAFREREGREPDADETAMLAAHAVASVRGTVQADILKEDQGQNTCLFSTEFSLRMMADIQAHFIEHGIRNFYSVSISGYHIAEAGANPISQLAFTLANGFTYVEAYLARGMDIDDFAPNLSFFFSNGMDPEYSVIGRVARRIWAVAMRDKYGASERSQKLKYHVQTSGRSLHAQEMDFNDIRATLQALIAIYDNANSLHTNAYDEAVTTPGEESVRRALAIQLIINREWGLAMNENPLQGSFIIDQLTDLVEEAVLTEFDRINERGGVLGAMETGYQRGRIQDESMLYEHRKHDGSLPIVGVNTFLKEVEDDATPQHVELARATDEEKESQLRRVHEFQRAHEDEAAEALARLKAAATSGENVFAVLMDAARVCSLGQVTEAFFEVGGQYRRNV